MKKIFDGILIVSDIDGTFLDSNERPVPKNISAIKYFTENGGRFTVASGRAHYDVKSSIPVLEELINAPAILANGTYLYDFSTQETVSPIYMTPCVADGILSVLRADFKNLDILAFADGGIYSDAIRGDAACVRDRLDRQYFTEAPICDWPPRRWLKFILVGDPNALDTLTDRLDECYKDSIHHSRSDAKWLEIQACGSSKGSRIEYLNTHFTSEVQELCIIAAGDYENDIEMLLAADVAVCPENAIDEVKRVADYCLCHHDLGLISDIVESIESGKIQIR
ncbi:MAG: HAD hydrolase family protein [Clostridia bacterium]|nr:HAD hydrolase family protein [Clostridia bacterium]